MLHSRAYIFYQYKYSSVNVTLILSEERSFVLVQWEQVVGGCFGEVKKLLPSFPKQQPNLRQQ